MKTNKFLDEIRQTMTPEMKRQMEMSVKIANRIYEIMEEKGLSQKDLARLLGKTETEVSRWLSGTHNMTMATIAKISEALDTDIIRVTSKRRRKEVVMA
ncbi:MAG: helix-turn-helix transcriptional regulator [Bacteroidales bacterium]|nr:helix-turn-helix transcriptional regulator [Bacteroidales bacterium]